MSLENLAEGISKHIQQGDTPETIRGFVLEAGYTPEEFADAYARAMALLEAPKIPVPLQSSPVASSTPQTPKAGVDAVSEKPKSPVFAIILLIILTLFVLGAVGFYILNPDFLRDFATSRIEASIQQ